MFLSLWKQVARQGIALALAGLMPAAVSAQTAEATASQPAAPQPHNFELKDYSRPRSHFPNLIGPYTSQHVPPPDLNNTPRIQQVLREGMLYLYIDDAVALAVESSLDIAIQTYNL